MPEPQLTTTDIQAILVAKANIELQNIALRRQIIALEAELATLRVPKTGVNHDTPDIYEPGLGSESINSRSGGASQD